MSFPELAGFKRTLLLGGLALSVLSAQAAVGDQPHRVDESQIRPGMSTQQVLQALGRPGQIARFIDEPGPTWTYTLDIGAENALVFDVDFDREGKVLSASERIQDLNRRFRH